MIKDMIYVNQYVFFTKRSTSTNFYNQVFKILDDEKQYDVSYLDFRKAFNSVPHALLIRKLEKYGNLLYWFADYLTNRRQRVIIEGESSDYVYVIFGVPQGSILGPLLFILYINDISSGIDSNMLSLYADDAKLGCESNSIQDCYLL